MTSKDKNLNVYQSGKVKPNTVKFSHNWNSKLDCKYFTTIRNTKSFAYYSQRELEVFDVLLHDKFYCKARLLSAEINTLDKITPALLVLDTGTTDWKELFTRFHVIVNCTLLLFERI